MKYFVDQRLLRIADVLRDTVFPDMAEDVKSPSAKHAEESLVRPFSLLGGLDLKAAIIEAARCCNVKEAQIEDVYPCTPLQEELMAITRKNIGSQVISTVFELPETIDFSRLRAAWITASPHQ